MASVQCRNVSERFPAALILLTYLIVQEVHGCYIDEIVRLDVQLDFLMSPMPMRCEAE